MKQMTLARHDFEHYRKPTRCEKLVEMHAVMPWAALVAVIEPHCRQCKCKQMLDEAIQAKDRNKSRIRSGWSMH